MACPSNAAYRAGLFPIQPTDPSAPWYDATMEVGCVRRSVDAVTVGPDWLKALFVTLNVNVYRTPAKVSPASVSTSTPLLIVQLPLLGRVPGAYWLAIGSDALVGVTVPVKPPSVTIGLPATPATDDLQVDKSGTLDCSSTVIVFGAHGHGVLWLAVRTVQLSADMKRGASPVTGIIAVFVIAGGTCILTEAAGCADC